MVLTPELAQKIAFKTTAILGYNVNIMNDAGIIIGSGDTFRVKCFHEGAYEVVRAGVPMEITIEDSIKLEGVKPGVNLPITFNNKIVGVVGITGSPDEVRQYGQLLTMLVETMLSQYFLTEQGRLEERAKENFILDILRYDNTYSMDLIVDRGKALGINIVLPRLAVAVTVEELEQYTHLESHHVTAKMEISMQKLKDDIISSVQYALEQDKESILTFIKGNILLVLKVIDSDDPLALRSQKMAKLCKKIQDILHLRKGLTTTIGIGSYHEGIKGLRESYLQAVDALHVGKKLRGSGEIYQYNELGLGVMLNSLNKEHKESFIQYFEKQRNLSEIMDEAFLETLEGLFNNSFNISETARGLFLHRNTLLYRLEKINKTTGLNPLNFNDALNLKIYLMLKKLR